MEKILKRTKYCDLLAQGTNQEGNDISAVERIFIKKLNREEIRFAWYKIKEDSVYFQPRPLDITEDEFLELLKDGINKGVFTNKFIENLKNIL